MTLSPIENRHVRAVPSTKYPINKTCSHPECTEPAVDAHHCFRRSQIGGDSYFVEVEEDEGQLTVIPHVVGLCRKHHRWITDNNAWIKLEDWQFVWYDKLDVIPWGEEQPAFSQFVVVGQLNPQPGYSESKPKRKRKQGEERRKRKTISIRVPADTEDGGEVWDENLALVKERLVEMDLYGEYDKIPDYEAIIAAWTDWLNS